MTTREELKRIREANEEERKRGWDFARREMVRRVAFDKSIRQKDVSLSDAFYQWGLQKQSALEIDIPVDASYLFERGVEDFLKYVKDEIIRMFPPKTRTVRVEIQ